MTGGLNNGKLPPSDYRFNEQKLQATSTAS